MMCSFNAIRGVPACANHRAMQTWAKGETARRGPRGKYGLPRNIMALITSGCVPRGKYVLLLNMVALITSGCG